MRCGLSRRGGFCCNFLLCQIQAGLVNPTINNPFQIDTYNNLNSISDHPKDFNNQFAATA
jgi:hypothetical protein